MGFRLGSNFTNTPVNPAIVAAGPTDILVLPAINVPIDNAQVVLIFAVALGIDAVATGIEFDLYRGTSTTGVLLSVWGADFVAASMPADSLAGCWVDVPGIVAEQVYTLTGLTTAGVGNSAIFNACLIAMCL
jgi:hypothetical protein